MAVVLAGTDGGQAEIHDLGMPPLGHENIRRLDVAVNNSLGMRRIQRIANIQSDLQKAMQLYRFARRSVLQSDAIEKLHDDERLVLIIVDLMDGADIGMVESGSRARLAPEARQSDRILRYIWRQKLDRHETAEFQVLSLVDHSHAAAAEFFHNAVVGNSLADHRKWKTPLACHVRDRRQASQCIARLCRGFGPTGSAAFLPYGSKHLLPAPIGGYWVSGQWRLAGQLSEHRRFLFSPARGVYVWWYRRLVT